MMKGLSKTSASLCVYYSLRTDEFCRFMDESVEQE